MPYNDIFSELEIGCDYFDKYKNVDIKFSTHDSFPE